MNSTSGTHSIWTTTGGIPQRQPLDHDVRCDVCVVGGGIAGLTTAYLLSRAGQAVVVLERGEIGSGETGRTTAHLVNALDDRYSELARLHGEDGARLAADSHTKAIDQVEAIVTLEHIACEFERLDGYVFVPPGEDASILDEELEAAHRAGVNAVHLVARTPWQTFETGPALCFPRQAQFHPMKYLVGLTQATESHGGRIHTGTPATEIKGGPQATIVLSGLHAPGMRRPVEQY